MDPDYAELKSDDRVVAQFLRNYHRIWQRHFPDLIKRAHWHTIVQARLAAPGEAVSCRTLHRALYGAYGTDIRTCIERIKECEAAGFLRVVDASDRDCAASAACFFTATDKLRDHFQRQSYETVVEVHSVFGDHPAEGAEAIAAGDHTAHALFGFFGAYDQKWRDASDFVVRRKGLTTAHIDDAMNHLVTYQYWAIVMLLWVIGAFDQGAESGTPVVVDEIISRMWETLRLGHLAIKERVDNLIRWGFFEERTVKKRKAVLLSSNAAQAMSRSLSETMPLLRDLYRQFLPAPGDTKAALSA